MKNFRKLQPYFNNRQIFENSSRIFMANPAKTLMFSGPANLILKDLQLKRTVITITTATLVANLILKDLQLKLKHANLSVHRLDRKPYPKRPATETSTAALWRASSTPANL